MDPWTPDPAENRSWADSEYEPENSAGPDAENGRAAGGQDPPPTDAGHGRRDAPPADLERGWRDAPRPSGDAPHPARRHRARTSWKFVTLVTTVAVVVLVGLIASIVSVVAP